MKERIRALWNRFVNRETVTYLIFGVLTTLVNYLIYYGLLALGVHYLIANALAWIGGVLFAFFTNKRFVFESRDYSPKVFFTELWKFVAARLVTLGVETVFLKVTVDLLHMSPRLMKLAASVIVVILNYVFSKLFIFRKERSDDQEKENL